MLEHPIENPFTFQPHSNFGTVLNCTLHYFATTLLAPEHDLGLLFVQLVDGELFLLFGEGMMVGTEVLVLLWDTVTEEVGADEPVVCLAW